MSGSPQRMWSAALRTPLGIVAATLVGLVVLTAIFAPILWGPAAARIDLDVINQGPTAAHLFGTDALGRDLLLRVLVSTRLSLELALIATVLGLVLGLLLGAARVLLGRWVGRVADVVIHLTNAFPSLLMILFFTAVFGVTTTGAVLAMGLSTAPSFARLTRTLTASVEEQDFVAAARVSGLGRVRVLVRHVLPNVAELLILNGTLAAGGALVAFGGLSFLGIGIQKPQYDFGRLLNEGLPQLYVNPMAVLGPALAIVVAGLGFNLLGEAAAQAVAKRTARVAKVPRAAKVASPGASADDSGDGVLSVEGLEVSFPAKAGTLTPVRGVSLEARRGEMIGVVGESGSGKSLTAMGVAQLIEAPGRVTAGRLSFGGHDLPALSDREKREVLGTSLAVVFQNPMSSFNPVRRLGKQIGDGARYHRKLGKKETAALVAKRLTAVGIPRAREGAEAYPHQFSGGMQQRAMIAMGLMGTPRLIIADEPTTALDATTQSRVLSLLRDVCARDNAALLLISHDITVIRRVCERVLVMYAGRIVEELPAGALETDAAHPYTRALLSAVPDLETDRAEPLTVIPGRAPEPGELTGGCPFAPRCDHATDRCRTEEPALARHGEGRKVACWHPRTTTVDAVPGAGPTREDVVEQR